MSLLGSLVRFLLSGSRGLTMASQGELRLPSAVGKRRTAGRNVHCSGVGFERWEGEIESWTNTALPFPDPPKHILLPNLISSIQTQIHEEFSNEKVHRHARCSPRETRQPPQISFSLVYLRMRKVSKEPE